MAYTIKAKKIFLENQILENGCLYINNGKIAEINPSEIHGQIVDLEDLTLMPGLIDIHVHGGGGYDIMDGSYDAVNNISKYKLLEGVTSFVPTTVTSSQEKTMNAAKAVAEGFREGTDGARINGIFFEGPYINPKFKGAHPENFIKKFDLNEMQSLLDIAGNDMAVSVIVAPENENAPEFIKFLKEKGCIIRLGHSGAQYSETQQAFSQGANILVHAYNAMISPLSREPGILGASLDNNNIYTEIIFDNIHVHHANIKNLFKIKGIDKTILITDCMRAGGLQDGKYTLGELDVYVEKGIAKTNEGALAGSTLKLNQGVLNAVTELNLSLFDANKMASQTPAKAMGIYNETGSISVGKRADLIGCTDEMDIKFIMVDGVIKHV